MRAVDTNVLVRLVARDDESQTAASETFVSRGAWVSQLVLAETMWVLRVRYQLEHAGIAIAVEMLLSQEHLTFQDADVVQAALGLYRQKPGLGFSDCLVLEIAKKAGHVPLGTFDRALSKLDGVERL